MFRSLVVLIYLILYVSLGFVIFESLDTDRIIWKQLGHRLNYVEILGCLNISNIVCIIGFCYFWKSWYRSDNLETIRSPPELCYNRSLVILIYLRKYVSLGLVTFQSIILDRIIWKQLGHCRFRNHEFYLDHWLS